MDATAATAAVGGGGQPPSLGGYRYSSVFEFEKNFNDVSLIHDVCNVCRMTSRYWQVSPIKCPTVVRKCENVILNLIRHETYVNISGFSEK